MARLAAAQPAQRKEDLRLLTGRGRFADDASLPGQAYGHVLRSPHAHARIGGIDAAAARAAPGVLAVFTGADVRDLGPLPCLDGLENRDGSAVTDPPHRVLATERVRHVGDNLAFVVAETLAQAKDAAELIEVAWEPLPSVTDTGLAVEAGAPRLWDHAEGNVAFDWGAGDPAAVAAASARADRVVTLDLVNNRLVVNTIEPRGALGSYDPAAGIYNLETGSQGVHYLRRVLARHVLKVPEKRIRVVTGDVGGAFGMKNFLYAEAALVLFAARALGRPVKWTGERSDAFVSDAQARDHVSRGTLALDAQGRFLALGVETLANMGAYLSAYATGTATLFGTPTLTGPYRFEAVDVRVRGVFTNSVPVDAYRGAGQPEAAYLVERLVDAAARALGLGRAEIRRRNLVPAAALPYTTPLGTVFVDGDYPRNLRAALERADWEGFAGRRAESAARDRLRGIGLALYVEGAGGMPGAPAELRFDPAGRVTALVGGQASGQGHATAYARIIAERLGIAFEDIDIVQGDSGLVRFGSETGGSGGLQTVGVAVAMAADKIIAKARILAADLLEAAAADIDFADGVFTVVGTDRSVTIDEAARAAFDPAALPARTEPGTEPGLDAIGVCATGAATYPSGCHVCEVEVDADTGAVEILRFTVVNDFGRILNPAIVAGQVHGGVAQGVGQALTEHCVYETENGQLLTGSLMDYALPRAGDLPAIDFDSFAVPAAGNPLGVKGCGEAGAIGAPPAVMSAVLDALAPLGVRHLDMPATPFAVWRAIRDAG